MIQSKQKPESCIILWIPPGNSPTPPWEAVYPKLPSSFRMLTVDSSSPTLCFPIYVVIG